MEQLLQSNQRRHQRFSRLQFFEHCASLPQPLEIVMAPAHNKLTIHPWLDAPLYNRIRYPQRKIYFYNASQKLCTALDPTGANCLVARNTGWETHPTKYDHVPLRPATIPRSRCPPSTIGRLRCTNSNCGNWKKKRSNGAETILHAAIFESLSQGTIRTINL